ncbi:MAG: tubulin-like doman-containing protein [Planctomycetota bacterium]
MTESNNRISDLQLPGYNLRELLGAGGYGEVWLADAPGGLTKAVKVIFGFHNEKRAARELKSLEKIKAVRHPFLLSLERIEIIEGRLVVVTELADGSLKDRFEHFRGEGQTGVPREELLGYLRDSADALDYLSDQHSLQHLDVKPENLLLVAGHVKVADFGLVKEIQDTQASLVGGMTPLYSAPEVFQGKPTIHSDQYSLAVLYQEMLTGKLPFAGTTAAELTMQHMHDDPDLSPLPQADRYVLARALSKDPGQRFGSCRELVKALLQVDQADSAESGEWNSRPVVEFASSVPAANEDLRKSRPGTMTQVFEDELIDDPADVSTSMLMDLPSELEVPLQVVPPLDLPGGKAEAVPTLVIGIGGTAGHVLNQLRQRLSTQYGTRQALPSLQLLLLDTDKKALLEATHNESDACLVSEETLALQLRRPQDYRDHASRLSSWLSRRWLYNIPKSLRTEGLRPLGRLAFADHARRVIQRIRLSISQAMEEDALRISQETTGCSFSSEAVNVYVVASISGGTGSGMSIDLGYAVKGLLEKLGIENATTTGVILHSTGRDSRYCDLAKVNAFSWFQEYNHFTQSQGFYPGDEASGLPAMPVDTPVFDNTYFVKLGDGLSPTQLKESTGAVAQYLLLDSLSNARKFFKAGRSSASRSINGQPMLRSFGLHEEATLSRQTLEAITHKLCQRVVLSWSGSVLEHEPSNVRDSGLASSEQETTSVSETSQIISGAPRAVASLQLHLEGISANARQLLEGQFGTDVDEMLSHQLAELSDSQGDPPAAALRQIDALFSAKAEGDSSGAKYVYGRRLDSIVSPLGMKLAADLQRWLLSRLDERQERLAGARQAAEWFAEHLKRVEADSQRLGRAISGKLVAIVNEFGGSAANATAPTTSLTPTQLQELAVRYFRLRLDLCALQATGQLVRTLQSELKALREAIVEFGRHLRHLADKLVADHQDNCPADGLSDCGSGGNPVFRSLMSKLPELAESVDRHVQEQFIGSHGGLFQTVMGNRKVFNELLDVVRKISSDELFAASRELTKSGASDYDADALANYVQQSTPSMLDLGGVGSRLLVMPQEDASAEAASRLRELIGSESSILAGVGENLVLCTEVAGVPLARVAIDLIECRRDYADFAARVHTRCDISWSPLVASGTVPTGEVSTSMCATHLLTSVQ